MNTEFSINTIHKKSTKDYEKFKRQVEYEAIQALLIVTRNLSVSYEEIVRTVAPRLNPKQLSNLIRLFTAIRATKVSQRWGASV